MSLRTYLELELNGRGQGWTDVSADLGDSTVQIKHGISGSGIGDRVAGSGTASFELVNADPVGKYSLNSANKISGFMLGIGVRIRIETSLPGGTGSGYQTSAAVAELATTMPVDTGTGSIQSGDVFTVSGISGIYSVLTGGNPATSITFEPGLEQEIGDNTPITITGKNFVRHRGRLDAVNPEAGIFERRTVKCTSVDWIDDAARAKLEIVPIQQDKRADEIFVTLVNQVPFQPVAIQADVSPDVFSYALDTAKDERTAVLAELQKVALSEFGLIYVKANGTVVFESRNRRALSEGTIDTFRDTETVSGFESATARDDTLSRVQIVTHPRKVDTAPTTVLFRLDNPFEVGPNQKGIVSCPYRDPAQEAERVGGVDMVTPVANADYKANSQKDGLGTDLTAAVSLTASFGGNSAQVEVDNSAAQIAWITLLQLRGRGIYDYQNVVLNAEDAAAQIEIGTSQTADLPYQDNAALGAELAIWLLNLYKNQEGIADTVTVRVPRSDEALANRVLQREISDRIDVVEQVTGFSVLVNGGNFIQSVVLGIDERDNLTVTWGLAPANRQQFWLLEIPGRTELDFTTVLGFGLVVGHTDVDHCDTHNDELHFDVVHTDLHTDTHTDEAHGDSSHTDTHGDTAHDDVAHVDSHGDVAHDDVSHADSHSDVAHVDSHADVAHDDVHSDQAYGDYNDHVDGDADPFDDHEDVPHTDTHTDVAHVDAHSDVAHSDSHSDVSHDDVAHVDSHADVAHTDVNHVDTHGDAGHSDAAHGDVAHVDTHTDALHQDTPHGDDHCDVSHGDVN